LHLFIIVRSVTLGFDAFEHWQISLAARNELLSSSEALLSGHRRYPFHEVIFLLSDLGLAEGAIENAIAGDGCDALVLAVHELDEPVNGVRRG
jgi:hypothetical protein